MKHKYIARSLLVFCCLITIIASGCGPKVLVPPLVDLTKYGKVGLIVFNCDAKGNLGEFVTQKFMERVSFYQKDARIIELGTESRTLKSIQRDAMGPEAIKDIGKEFKVKAVILGNLQVSKIQPKIKISSILASASASAKVEATLTVRLIETESGATVWTNSVYDNKTVAQVSVFSGGGVSFDAKNPDEAYGDLAKGLVEDITLDFKVKYKRN